MEAKQISKAVIKRLPRYYRYLGELLEDNVERISSNDLSHPDNSEDKFPARRCFPYRGGWLAHRGEGYPVWRSEDPYISAAEMSVKSVAEHRSQNDGLHRCTWEYCYRNNT